MKFKILTGAFLLSLVLVASGAAQQHPDDLGAADTAFWVISEPVVGAVDQVVTAELYFWNDGQDLANAAFGFGWDNPNLQMESVVWSPEAVAGFISRLEYYRNSLDSTNVNQKFQCVLIALFNPGMAASDQPKLIATYTFRASSWSASDQFCIDTEDFSTNTFVGFNNLEYPPIYDGPFCVGNVPTGMLEADPTSLNFLGVATEGNPPFRLVAVTEAGGQNIPFDLATDAGWINLPATTGITPQDMTVGIDNTGLGAGDYQDSVMITSAAATNTAWVYVNLHLDPPNQPPVLDPIGGQGGPENSLIEFTVTASDPDGGFPALTASSLPGTASFTDHGDGTGTFSWMTTYDDAGAYPITFTASDGALTDDESITLTVTNVNRDPVLDPIGDQMVLEGVNLSFTVSATDPDLESLVFYASSLPGTATFTYVDGNTALFDWTPGNTDAGAYVITFTVEDPSEASDAETITIEIINADGFVLPINPAGYGASLGGPNPPPVPFIVDVSDHTSVDFVAEETVDWFSLSAYSGTTPQSVEIIIDITGLAADYYYDSILISDPSGGLDPVWQYVILNVHYNLVVDPTSLTFDISEGDLMVPSQTLNITEQAGGPAPFEATDDADWLLLSNPTGTAPGSVTVDVDFGALAVGEHNATITITGEQSRLYQYEVPVTVTVSECPTLAPAAFVSAWEIFAGEMVQVFDIVPLTSSGPGEIDWEITLPPASPYDFGSLTGTTPNDLTVNYERIFDTEGQFADTAYINAVETDTYLCPSQVMVITNVTVNRPPSADTIIVVNTPAVPGMRVGVPVIFTNSCRLNGLGLSLNWPADLHLDSVSFAGSVIEYLDDKTATINNDMDDVTIVATVGAQMMVPIGSEQLLATLYFALSCEIEDGTYGFSLGSTPPLTPADVYFHRDCGEGEETEFPEYIPGNIIVGSASNFVCGYVVDPFDNEIEGATVELWEDYPFTEPLLTTMSSGIGGFAFDELMVIPFDLYAYKEGYYPGSAEDNNFGDKGVKIVLTPLPETMTPTSEWVDYYCPEGGNIFLSAPVPVGAVVEAYTLQGLLVGQKMAMTSGQYGFMPVYRGNETFGEVGAMTGDMIRFTINGMDALTTGSTMYPDEFMQMEVCLEVRGTVEKVCTLFDGWNLISWNVNTDTDDILNVLAPVMDYVDVVLGFEQGGLTFDPDLQAFSTLWEVDHYSGYWVRIVGATELALTVTGLPVPETTPIALTAGWNLVSYLPEQSMATETALATIEPVVEFAYGFPSGNIQIWAPGGAFNQLETFDPCNGYWIKTTADAWLTYGGSDPAPATPRPRQQEMALSTSIARTNWVNLYSKSLMVDGRTVTAGTTITAHAVESDNVVGSFTMSTDGQFGFMPVYAAAAGESADGLQAGEEFYLMVNEVKTNEVFTWTNNGDRVEITELSTAGSIGDVLPEGYSLAQNYPNPFNPNTSIAFNMPVAGHAKIEIFNVLGRSIGVIFDGQAQAGENKVVWDGRNTNGDATASGVYFYRLTADKYTETRKMMLLK